MEMDCLIIHWNRLRGIPFHAYRLVGIGLTLLIEGVERI